LLDSYNEPLAKAARKAYGLRDIPVNMLKTGVEKVLQVINPKDERSLLNRMDELSKACGGKKH
jgi:hypothetical protein